MQTEIDIIHEINSIFKENKYGNVYLYLFCESNEFSTIFTPKKFNNDFLKSIKHSKEIVKIEEFYYRDLVKIVINNTNISYVQKNSNYKIINDCLLYCVNYTEIQECNFPRANIEIKNVKNLELINIFDLNLKFTELILENNSLCIKIKQKPSSSTNKKELRNEISNIVSFIKNLH